MRKYLLWIIVLLGISIPFKVKAISIKDIDMKGEQTKKVGDNLDITLNIYFSDMENKPEQTSGIRIVMFQLVYDEKILKPVGISSPNFESHIFQTDDGKYYVLSETITNPLSPNNCVQGYLYCSDYSISIQFTIRDTNAASSTIEASEIMVGLLDITEDREYTLDDIMELSSDKRLFHTVLLEQKKVEVPKKPVTTPPIKKSSNRYLKSLEIENVELDFHKETSTYTIYVDSDVNELNMKLETEDSKASYQVIGADNLKNSNYIVRIEVTAEDKTKNTYYIKVKQRVKESEIVEKAEEQEKVSEEKVDSKKLTHNILKWLGIVLGVVCFMVVVMFLISKVSDKSIDKKLKELDEE